MPRIYEVRAKLLLSSDSLPDIEKTITTALVHSAIVVTVVDVQVQLYSPPTVSTHAPDLMTQLKEGLKLIQKEKNSG